MKWPLAIAGAVVLGGCGLLTFDVTIRAASLTRTAADTVRLTLTIARGDLQKIVRHELSPSAQLLGCRNGFDYPVYLELNGARIDDFDAMSAYLAAHRDAETVEFGGDIPAFVAAQMDSFCVRFLGGNIFGMRVRSDMVRVAHAPNLLAPPIPGPPQPY